MKTKIHTLLFLLICTSLQVNSQTSMLIPVYLNEQKVTHIKAIETKYFNGKVYLHITVNGNTETKILAVERSLDATNYEVLGYIKIYSTSVQCDLAYYFIDEIPVAANMYYRLSDNTNYNEPVYSETLSVIPVNENKTPAGTITTTSISNEQTLPVDGSTN